MFKIYPFIITNYDDMSVLQNSINTVILKNKDMIDFFNWVDAKAEYEVSIQKISGFFNEITDDAIEFMKSNNLIEIITPKKISFKNVVVVSNDVTFLNSIKFNSGGHRENFIYEELQDNLSDYKIKGNDDLYIFFLNPFNYKRFTELVNIVRNNNVLCRFAFYYNYNIFLSNYYKKDWVNPCPLCFFGNLESSLRGKYSALNTVSFQTLLDLIYKKDPKFQIENLFTNYSISPLVNVILNELDINDNSLINNVQYIDFNKNIVLMDEAIHWELCDCYE